MRRWSLWPALASVLTAVLVPSARGHSRSRGRSSCCGRSRTCERLRSCGDPDAMITESHNDAQDTLWNEIGMTALQRFLTAAGMKHTVLGTDDYWGLTAVNAHDELRLL
jgi:hypothetical protein